MLEANTWTLGAAVELCGKINDVFEGKDIIRRTPYHVALTGGCLYRWRQRTRKDCDIVIYGADELTILNKDEIAVFLSEAGLEMGHDYGRVWKAMLGAKAVDFIFPGLPQNPGEPTYAQQQLSELGLQ
jgi:hypothetical protein